jgi:NADH-quinone oxidoreductase subunit N
MNPQAEPIVQSLLQPFDAAAWTALAPLVVLAVGAILLLVAGITPVGRPVRVALVVAPLLLAGALNARLLASAEVPGVVLDGSFAANHATALWGLLFVLGTLIAWLYSVRYYDEESAFKCEHDVLLLAAPVGMMLMAGARDLIVFFIGLELLSIPLYALAAFRRERARSVEAGLKYFLLGAFAVGLYLYGAALLYTATGSISLDAFADPARRAVILAQPNALVGAALVAASVFFKLSVFPLHMWVPDVYEGSPTPITGLMATGTKAAALAFLLNAAVILPHAAANSIALIALLTMAAGNFGALVQTDVKRMLAYSGIAHAGTVLLAVAGSLAGDPKAGAAIEASLFYMAAYVATAGGAFGLLAILERDGKGETTLDSLRGLAQRRPVIAAALTLFMLSLGGIPATGGFLGKYLVFSVAVRADLTIFAVLGVLLSVVALGYYLRVVIAMYMQAPAAGAEPVEPRPAALASTIASFACAVLVLWMGLLPRWFLDAM